MNTATTTELPKSYRPEACEASILERWDQVGAFHGEPDGECDPYCILIPPPNVTAALHLGHAFNNTLQDILTRYHRMRGFNTLWMPGTDHAGISTQSIVDKRLQTEGKPALKEYKQKERAGEHGREQFIAKVQEWKDEYEATITEQLKAMGASCDWQRQRFTMDDMCAKAVREAFFRLFRDGLIYRGKRLVNWDPVTLTALADDEVEMKEVDGHFWYLRYPLVHPSTNSDDPLDCQEVTWSELAARGYPGAEQHDDDENAWVTVATTRPETYLGDTAVAVNPKDPRAAALDGLCAQLPLVGRVIPIIHDEYVVLPDADSSDAKAQYATGFLKVTPAHDPNDYDIGQRHDLPIVNVMAPDASISDRHGWEDVGDARMFVGMTREDARTKVVQEFEARKLLEATKPYSHSVGHSYRSHVPVEPYLSDQWYVKVTDDRLVGEAQRALVNEQFEGEKPAREGANGERTGDAELRFFPARYAKQYQAWHDNLRDWCISRQLWWGHRIPVWTVSFWCADDQFDQAKQTFNGFLEAAQITEDTCFRQASDEEWHLCARSERAIAELTALEERVAIRLSIRDTQKRPGQPYSRPSTPQHQFSSPAASIASEEVLAANVALAQDPDVLDTWFSSGLWPLSTMGWPTPDGYPDTPGLLDTFNPSSVLSTGRDIITLWVSRMVMFNRYFNDGKVPYRHVYVHPMIQDGHGQRMSKSLGNGVDPRDIIETHGADALRFTMAYMATTTQDARLPVDMLCPHCGAAFHPREGRNSAGYTIAAPEQTCPKCSGKMVSGFGVASGVVRETEETPLARNTSTKFDRGRNFANKLWNAARFAILSLNAGAEDAPSHATPLPGIEGNLVDRWIITRLHRTLHAVEDAIAEYQFDAYARAMDQFIWGDFCDWYLEAIKPTIRTDPHQKQTLRTVLNATLRLLHPICPFVTEELWPHVRATGEAGVDGIDLPDDALLARAAWPRIACRVDDDDAADTFERMQALVNAIRQVRAEHNLPVKRRVTLHAPASIQPLLEAGGVVITSLAGIEALQSLDERPGDAVALAFEGEHLFLSGLVDAVDRSAEQQRLTKRREELERAVAGYRKKLENPGYVNNAPAAVVEETRQRLEAAEADLSAARRALETLEND